MSDQPFIDEATLNELEQTRKGILARMPDIDKAIKAGLASEAQKTDIQAALARVETILRVYRPSALQTARK